MYSSKLGVVRASLLLGCWSVVQATSTALRAQDGAAVAAMAAPADNDPSERIFIVISPEPCTSASGVAGICRSSFDCGNVGGRVDGRCAWLGLGYCCVTTPVPPPTPTCSSTTSATETTFVNPKNPSAETQAIGACSLTVKAGTNICQLRLDLTEFTLGQPDNEGQCITDFLTVTGGNTVPKICGENAGQHMYVDVTAGSNVVLNVNSQSANNKWKIKVTQIACDSPNRAPSGCLQYFTTTSGIISSFNFNPAATSTSIGTRQLAGQSYSACIKPQPGLCSITYRQAPGSTFSLSSDPSSLPPTIPQTPIVGGTDCTSDYIIVAGGRIYTTGLPASADRFCGLAFPDVTSSLQPFILTLVTDANEATAGDSNNQGFSLKYNLNVAC